MGVIKHSLRFDGDICEVVVVCVCAITIQQLSSPPSLHVQVESSPFFPIAGLSRDLPPCHTVSQEIAEPGPEPNETKKNLTLLPRHSRDLPLNPQPRAGTRQARHSFLGQQTDSLVDGLDRMLVLSCSVTHYPPCPEINHIVLIVALGKEPGLGLVWSLDGTGTPYRKRVAAESRSESRGI